MYPIHTVTVVGANGTMGKNISAIFASFGNAKVYMISRTVEKSASAIEASYKAVRAESIKNNMIPADYSMLEKCIADSDLVFESSAENWSIKSSITQQIAEAAERQSDKNQNTVFCTGTSGLSITSLAELFSPEIRGNYMGIHMFNPPYVMTLTEVIPTEYSKKDLLNMVQNYLKDILHRTVVEVHDSPAFLANRIGFQFINRALQCAEKYKFNGGIDYIDAILGPFTGRGMAPLLTSNFVGLDVHKAIVDNIHDNTKSFNNSDYQFPDFAERLVQNGYLGQKSGKGLYYTYIHESGTKIRQVYDIETNTYRNVIPYTFPYIEKMISALRVGDYLAAFDELKVNYSSEATICCDFLIRYVLDSIRIAKLIGCNAGDADDVMAAGFNWCPPMAMIEAFGGVNEFKKLVSERMDQSLLQQYGIKDIYDLIKPSKYDYRKYIRAIR